MTSTVTSLNPPHAQDGPHGRLLDELVSTGALTASWRGVFEDVPREQFIPDVAWVYDVDHHSTVRLDRDNDPAGWLDRVYANVPIVTQWERGSLSGPKPQATPTSSASMPSVVAQMLRHADVTNGNRVWEIGTGTGWGAALLARRAGCTVVSTEVDATVAEAARARLAAYEANVDVRVGDALDDAHRAEYGTFDRIVVTCGLRDLSPLLPHLRDGGMVVSPWGTYFTHREALVRLTRTREGHGLGKMLTPVEFMRTRTPGHTSTFDGHSAYVPGSVHEDSVQTTSRLPRSAFVGELDGSWGAMPFVLGLRVPHCRLVVAEEREGMQPVWLYSLTDRSWAVLCYQREREPTTVFTGGTRNLLSEVEAAHNWWEDHGQPGWGRLGLLVEHDGPHHVWVDEPSNRWSIPR